MSPGRSVRDSVHVRETPEAFARELVLAATVDAARQVITRWTPVLSLPTTGEEPPTARSGDVGIWRQTRVGEATWFVRDPQAAVVDGWGWAAIERIGPKRGTRVVLLGESCARAWPLDPFLTCASALKVYLAAAAPGRDIEIVDLARLAIRPPALLSLLEAAAVLEPDLYVIFAGNNWHVHPRHAMTCAGVLTAEKSWRAVAARCEQAVRSQIAAWVRELVAIVATRGTPTLFVIPAENIQDYPNPSSFRNPLVASDAQIRRDWLIEHVDALQRDGRFAESEGLAADLVDVEERCGIAGLHALARCALARGRVAEAARLFEEARELLISLPMVDLDSYVARTSELRAGLHAAGVPTVDLPRAFAQRGGTGLPGRDLFYDNCHMTAAGVAIAMQLVAGAVLEHLHVPAQLDVLAQTPLAVDPRGAAQAALVAALTNTHDERLVRRYLTDAIACWPEIGDVLRLYLDVRRRRGPLALCPAFHRLRAMADRFPAVRYLSNRPGDRSLSECDAMVASVIADALAQSHPSTRLPSTTRLPRKYAGDADTVDLLEHVRWDDLALLEQYPYLYEPRAYVRCLFPRVRVSLIAKSSAPRWRLRLTTRAPQSSVVGKAATLIVNGRVIATWCLTAAWTTTEAVCDPHGTAGADDLTIVWPDPGEDRDERIRKVASAMADGVLTRRPIVDVYTVWGDIQSFTASALVEPPAVVGPRPARSDNASVRCL